MQDINKYRKNRYYSQYGEDGIVEETLKRIKKKFKLDGWCCEFGAWDGIHFSNTCYFIKKLNYKAILIEGDFNKTKELELNFPSKKIIKENKFVDFKGSNSLDNIFKHHKIPKKFDFLSIDVDGVDYHIFDSLKKYRPKIICIEYNPTIPNSVEFIQERNFKIKHGSSAKSIIQLAEKKKYSLVALTECNLIFVDQKYKKNILVTDNSLINLNPKGNDPTYIFTGYDGSILSNKKYLKFNWHNIKIPISVLQYFPKILIKYHADYNIFQRFIFALFYRYIKKIFPGSK